MINNDHSQANQNLREGVHQAQSGNLQEAAYTLEQALVLFRQSSDRQGEGQASGNLGLVYHFLGDYGRAVEYHRQSLALDRELASYQSINQPSTTDYLWGEYTTARTVGDRKSHGYTFFNLGFTYYWQNDYAKAIESYLSSLGIAREMGDRENEVRVLAQLGEVYFYLADYHRSIQYHEQAVKLAETIETVDAISDQGNSLNSLGNAYNKLGDWEQARKHYERALAVLADADNPNVQGNALAGIGIAYSNQNQYARAIEYFEQSLPHFQSVPKSVPNRYNEGRFYNLLGQVYAFLGSYEQAINCQERSLEISQSLGEPFSEAIVLAELGLIFFKSGRLVEAEEKLRQAIHLSETIREKLGSDDTLKVSIFERQAEPYQLLQTVLVSQNKIEAALEISERGRARALVELLSQRLTASSENLIAIDSLQVDQIRRISAEHKATLVEYSIIQTKGLEPTILIWVIKPNGEIALRQASLQSTEHQSISLKDLVFETREGMGSRSIEAFVLSGEAHELDRDVALHPEAEEPHSPDRSRPKLRAFYQLLIQPIEELLPELPEERIIFIPQGPLFLLPFAALIDANGNYLIEQHTVLISPSIQSLALTRQTRQRLGQAELQEALIVGNPTMPQITLGGEKLSRALLPLPGAEQEAEAVALVLNTQALIGSQATKVAVLSRMTRARMIHLATHGLLDDTRGLGSAIVLAASDTDGLLTAEEILQLNLQAGLVVLSACNTGRGRVTGDGVIGLSRSFIAAGVPSVIVSLWSVPDTPTASLMSEFYRQLQTHPDKAQALRQAMRTTMQYDPSPVNWAAFVLIGEAE